MSDTEKLRAMVTAQAKHNFNTSVELTQTKVVAKNFREALAELVDLKALKDACGKTIEYHQRQAKAWERARKLLAHTLTQAIDAHLGYIKALEDVAEAARWMDGPRDCVCWPGCRIDGINHALAKLGEVEKGMGKR